MVKKALTELCKPKQWQTISGKSLKETGYPVYGANGIIGYWDTYNHANETLTIACRGTCGMVNIAQAKSYINGNAMCLDSLSEEIELKYLYYSLKGYDFSKIISGTTIPQITIESLKKVTIAIPPIHEQKEIIRIFDRISEIILFRKQQLSTLDTLIKSRFVEMFGETESFLSKASCHVEDICSSRVGIVIQPTQYYTDNSDGIRAFRSLNVRPFFVNDSDWVYFTKESNETMERTQVHASDVVVVRSGVNLGDSCVIPQRYDGCNAIDILMLSCKNTILPEFLCAFINYPMGKNQIVNIQRGGAIKHLNLKQLMSAKIYLPPMEEQIAFRNFAVQVNKSKVAVQKALDEAQLLFDSLMQQYFG